MLTLINEVQAEERFSLKKHTYIFDSWQYDSYLQGKNLLLHEGDLDLNGALSLDWDAWSSRNVLFELEHDISEQDFSETVGLIVDGNLIIDGALVNGSAEGGPFLLVTGSLSARHLVAGGTEIRIRGNADIKEVTWGHYNDGSLHISGNLKSPVYVNDDHHISIVGDLDVQWTYENDFDSLRGEDENADEDTLLLVGELRELAGRYVTTWGDFQSEVWRGGYVLKQHDHLLPERSYDDWEQLVSAQGHRLASVPASLIDRSLCEKAINSNAHAVAYIPLDILDESLCMLAVKRDGWALHEVPHKDRTRSLCEVAAEQGCSLGDIPSEHCDEDMLEKVLLSSGHNIEFLLQEMGKEAVTPRLAAATIVGGYNYLLPDELLNEDAALIVLEHGIEQMDKLPGRTVSQKVLDQAQALFSSDPRWDDVKAGHQKPKDGLRDNFPEIWRAYLSEDDYLEVAKQGASLRMFDPSARSKAVVKVVLDSSIAEIEFAPEEHLTNKMCMRAVKQDYGELLQFVPQRFHSEDLFLESVLADGNTLEYVPKEHRTVPICMAAMIDSEYAIEYVPEALRLEVIERTIKHFKNQDSDNLASLLVARARLQLREKKYLELVDGIQAAVECDEPWAEAYLLRSMAQRHLNNEEMAMLDALSAFVLNEGVVDDEDVNSDYAKWFGAVQTTAMEHFTQQQWRSAVTSHPEIFRLMPIEFIDTEMVNTVVQASTRFLEFVPAELMTSDLYLIAQRDEIIRFNDIPEERITEAHCLLHIEDWGYNLKDIPSQHRSEEVCRRALRSSSSEMRHVPASLQRKLQSELDAEEKKWNKAIGVKDPEKARDNIAVKNIVLRTMFNKLFREPTIHLPAEKGAVRFLGERPMLLSLSNGLFSLLMLVLHTIVVVDIWQSSGWGWGSLAIFGLWFAELTWAWFEFQARGVSSMFVVCIFVVITWPIGQVFVSRVKKAMGKAFGR